MRASSARPFVSVIVPCLDEERSIAGCLASILEQTYPLDRLEVIVADGGSRDATLAIVARTAAAHPTARIRVVDNCERIQAAGCNRAIAVSRGDVIVRMDAHALYARDYVERCVEVLATTGADNVGGAQRPAHRTPFERAMALALESPLAVGGAAYRDPNREGFVDTVWLGAFRRRVFETVGMFDARAATNEDAELNLRIVEAGGLVYLSRSIVAHYYPRGSLRALARQYFRYGVGRARTSVKHRRLQSLRPLAPFALVVAAFALAVASLVSMHARELLAACTLAYGALALAEGVRVGRGELRLAATIAAIFPTIQFAWGAGFAVGLARYSLAPDWRSEPQRLPERLARVATRSG